MANIQMRPPNVMFTNSLKAVADPGSGSGLNTPLNYTSVTAMRTRLAAIGGVYTTAELDRMTTNDMVYALRMNDDKTTVSNYQP